MDLDDLQRDGGAKTSVVELPRRQLADRLDHLAVDARTRAEAGDRLPLATDVDRARSRDGLDASPVDPTTRFADEIRDPQVWVVDGATQHVFDGRRRRRRAEVVGDDAERVVPAPVEPAVERGLDAPPDRGGDAHRGK